MTGSGPGSGHGAIVLGDDQRLAWLRLIRSENVGPVTFRQLVNRFGGAEAALRALPDLAARGGRRVRVAAEADIEAELRVAAKMGARFVCRGEADYPAILRSDSQAPPVLAVMGDASQLQRPALAVVGARNASAAGAKFAATLSREAAEGGFAVVSGLARGIDAAAHSATLDLGTVGVFAGGLDKPYPRENRPLMRRMVDARGCLVSEMPFGWEPRAVDFPRRNRIVAALSLGLLVVEAAARSGSLISARLAGEMGRLVFAVPGSPLDPRSARTNRLLKDGAILVTEVDDILDALRPIVGRPPAPLAEIGDDQDFAEIPDEPAAGERERIVEALGAAPISMDDLVAHAGSSLGSAHLAILELDLAGRIERHPDGRISLLQG